MYSDMNAEEMNQNLFGEAGNLPIAIRPHIPFFLSAQFGYHAIMGMSWNQNDLAVCTYSQSHVPVSNHIQHLEPVSVTECLGN